jgi:hypothetical protein
LIFALYGKVIMMFLGAEYGPVQFSTFARKRNRNEF